MNNARSVVHAQQMATKKALIFHTQALTGLYTVYTERVFTLQRNQMGGGFRLGITKNPKGNRSTFNLAWLLWN